MAEFAQIHAGLKDLAAQRSAIPEPSSVPTPAFGAVGAQHVFIGEADDVDVYEQDWTTDMPPFEVQEGPLCHAASVPFGALGS